MKKSQSPIGSGPDMDAYHHLASGYPELAEDVTIAYRLRSRYGLHPGQRTWVEACDPPSQSPIGSGPDMDLYLDRCSKSPRTRTRSQSPIGSGPDMDSAPWGGAWEVGYVAESQSPIGSGPDMDRFPIAPLFRVSGCCHNRLSAPVPIWTPDIVHVYRNVSPAALSQSPIGSGPDMDGGP